MVAARRSDGWGGSYLDGSIFESEGVLARKLKANRICSGQDCGMTLPLELTVLGLSSGTERWAWRPETRHTLV